MKKILLTSIWTMVLMCCYSCGCNRPVSGDDYYVCAYVWPSCHDDSLGHQYLWPQGDGEWEVIRTEHYAVRRAGTLRFDRIPVAGSRKLDDRIGESLEPYDLSDAVPFRPAVLAGAMADRADVDAAACERRVAERVKTTMAQVIRETVNGYETVSVRGQDVRSRGGRVIPALMPVWLITTEKTENGQKKTYTFAINGQSGRLTCDVPYDGGKATKWFLGVFAGVFAAGYALMRLLMG